MKKAANPAGSVESWLPRTTNEMSNMPLFVPPLMAVFQVAMGPAAKPDSTRSPL